jgi:CheY-like chemotaxis protein
MKNKIHKGHLSNLTILVVDDEPLIRKLINREFTQFGCKVLEAENALDAFYLSNEHSLDIIISDVRMAGGDGIELLKTIKTDKSRKRPIIVMMSGYSALTEKEAHKYGAVAFFQKPLSAKVLSQFIHKIMSAEA